VGCAPQDHKPRLSPRETQGPLSYKFCFFVQNFDAKRGRYGERPLPVMFRARGGGGGGGGGLSDSVTVAGAAAAPEPTAARRLVAVAATHVPGSSAPPPDTRSRQGTPMHDAPPQYHMHFPIVFYATP
jgi:hypothetical protein